MKYPTLPKYLLQDFIWREQISDVVTNLDKHSVVVLYGMGGEGKTRLAVQTAYFIADPTQANEASANVLRLPGVTNKSQEIIATLAKLNLRFKQVAYIDMAICAENEEDEFTFWSTLSKGVHTIADGSTADSVREGLIRYLELPAPHTTLLVLDNGEQINANLMAKALSALARSTSVLVTCRYPIVNIQGGVNISIEPMRPPDPKNDPVINLQHAEAVRLFARRVGLELYPSLNEYANEQQKNEQQKERKQELDAFVTELLKKKQSVRTIARICSLWECIPLAIVQIASYAAWLLKDMLVKQSTSGLDSPHETIFDHIIHLLSQQECTAINSIMNQVYTESTEMQASKLMGVFSPQSKIDKDFADKLIDTVKRFDTLQASIQWSYNRLGFLGDKKIQQSLFRALSIFPGEWTLNDMKIVCKKIGDAKALSDAHQALQETHLVVPSRSGTTDVFTFLQPIREVAEKLCTDRDREHVQTYHCELFLGRLEAGLNSSAASSVNLDTYKKDIDTAMRFAFSSQPLNFKAIADVIEQTLHVSSRGYSAVCLPFARTLLDILEKNGISKPEAASKAETEFRLNDNNTKCVLPANLFHLYRGRMISRVVSNNAPLTALFGDPNPDYTTLHTIEEPEIWLRETEATILVLAQDLEHKTADEKRMIYRLLACMYFITHDWWDAYLQDDDATAGKVLEQWEHHAKDNKGEVHALLKQFDRSYPHKSERKGREQKKKEWRQVHKALEGLQTKLELSPPYFYPASPSETQGQAAQSGTQAMQGEPADVYGHALQPSRFLIGVLERYLGEAAFYLRHEHLDTSESTNKQGNLKWEEHYESSIKSLLQDKDSLFRFHRQWTYGDQAQRYMEAGENKVFDACYEVLTDEHSEFEGYIENNGINLNLLDLELLANTYSALGGGHARNNNPALASLCYSGAILLALAVMLIEGDTYGIRFYREHHEDRMDKRAMFAPSLFMWVKERFKGGHVEGRQARKTAFAAWTYFWKSEAASATPLVLSIKTIDALLLNPPTSEEELKTEAKLREVAAIIRQAAARISASPPQEDWWPKDKQELILLQKIATYFDENTMVSLVNKALEDI